MPLLPPFCCPSTIYRNGGKVPEVDAAVPSRKCFQLYSQPAPLSHLDPRHSATWPRRNRTFWKQATSIENLSVHKREGKNGEPIDSCTQISNPSDRRIQRANDSVIPLNLPIDLTPDPTDHFTPIRSISRGIIQSCYQLPRIYQDIIKSSYNMLQKPLPPHIIKLEHQKVPYKLCLETCIYEHMMSQDWSLRTRSDSGHLISKDGFHPFSDTLEDCLFYDLSSRLISIVSQSLIESCHGTHLGHASPIDLRADRVLHDDYAASLIRLD